MIIDSFVIYDVPGVSHHRPMESVGGAHSYRWIVVGVSTAVNALAWGVRSTFALFYVAMLAELAWGRGATAFGSSLSWLCFVLFAPGAGWLFDRLCQRSAPPSPSRESVPSVV